ncbi:MAG: glutaredoxin 3 [Candidatus Binatia bacterium]
MPSVLIYTLGGCPFCVRAIALLRSKGSKFTEVDVTRDAEGRRAACERSGHRTFPQIWIGDSFVGGCDELFALERAGRLDAMLA